MFFWGGGAPPLIHLPSSLGFFVLNVLYSPARGKDVMQHPIYLEACLQVGIWRWLSGQFVLESVLCGQAGTLCLPPPPVALLCVRSKCKVGLITQRPSGFCLLLVADSTLSSSLCDISFELKCKAGDGLLDYF